MGVSRCFIGVCFSIIMLSGCGGGSSTSSAPNLPRIKSSTGGGHVPDGIEEKSKLLPDGLEEKSKLLFGAGFEQKLLSKEKVDSLNALGEELTRLWVNSSI